MTIARLPRMAGAMGRAWMPLYTKLSGPLPLKFKATIQGCDLMEPAPDVPFDAVL